MSLHENAIFQVLTHMLLLRTLSRSRSPKPLSRSLSVARAHTQAFTRTETQSHLSTQHATETQTHLPTQHRAPRQESARASERRIDGLQCSRLKVATATTFRALHGNHIVIVALAVYPRLSSHHTFRALHGNHIVMVTLAVHPRLLLSWIFQNTARESHTVWVHRKNKKMFFSIFCISRTP